MQNIDSLGIEKSLTLFPEQVKSSWTEAFLSDLPKVSPKAVVISGMGGSSNAAKILEGLYEENFKVKYDIDVHNDYGLPLWVDKDTLVIANSYSGNTEETLSGVAAAKKIGAKVLGVTTGGKIKEMILSHQIEGVFVDGRKNNPSDFPKSGLGVSFGALIGTLAKIGVLDVAQNDLFDSLDELTEIRESWNVKETAEWVHGSLPVLFGGRPFIGALNAGRNAICEIGRTYCQFYDFPEVNHVLIEATQKPEAAKEKNRYLFFESNFNHERVKRRYEITRKIFNEQGLTYQTYTLKGKSALTQALEIPHFCAWLGFQLSVLDGEDPGPEPWITKLKEELS